MATNHLRSERCSSVITSKQESLYLFGPSWSCLEKGMFYFREQSSWGGTSPEYAVSEAYLNELFEL